MKWKRAVAREPPSAAGSDHYSANQLRWMKFTVVFRVYSSNPNSVFEPSVFKMEPRTASWVSRWLPGFPGGVTSWIPNIQAVFRAIGGIGTRSCGWNFSVGGDCAWLLFSQNRNRNLNQFDAGYSHHWCPFLLLL